MNNRLIFFVFVLMLLVLGGIRPTITQAQSTPVRVPAGVQTFKILTSEVGIYEILPFELITAGMNINLVDPATIQMMSNGKPIPYEFIGDSDNKLEYGEKIRFFATKPDVSRHDSWFIEDNVYWLWANGTPNQMTTIPNSSGYPDITRFPEKITLEENNLFADTLINENYDHVIGPDLWQWDEFSSDYPITIPVEINDPNPNFPVTISSELFSIRPYETDVFLKLNNSQIASQTIERYTSAYLAGSVPANSVMNGINQLTFESLEVDCGGGFFCRTEFSLNQIELTYIRNLITIDDTLRFYPIVAGNFDFKVSGFTETDTNNMLVYKIADVSDVKRVAVNPSDLIASTLTLGQTFAEDDQFFVTTLANVKTIDSITAYTGQSLQPSAGADWIAIAHPDLLSETNRLAAHRSATSALTTYVASWEDVDNQYGYGYGIPSAITTYLTEARANWSTQPENLLLVGPATLNPAQRPCSESRCINDGISPYVPVDITMNSRFLGSGPTDYTYMTLTGEVDPIQVNVGRLPASNLADLAIMVDKIIMYDSAVLNQSAWLNNHLLLADNNDQGGEFCDLAQTIIAQHLASTDMPTKLCLDDYFIYDDDGYVTNVEAAKAELRADFLAELNNNYAGFTHYRGSGSVFDWAGGVFSGNHMSSVGNIDHPTVLFSTDDLSGSHTWTSPHGKPPLSIDMLKQDMGRGSVAYVGRSNLGYSFEHQDLLVAMVDARTLQGATTFGEMVSAGLESYRINEDGHISQLYGTTVFGDPAMLIPSVNVPTAVTLSTSAATHTPHSAIIATLVVFGCLVGFSVRLGRVRPKTQ